MRVSQEVYSKLLNNSINYKQSKYKNKKIVIDGHKFDSQKEGNYYLKLKVLKDLGQIKDLELQKVYELQPSFKLNNKTYRKITYKADFCYISVPDNKLHVVDVKGFKTKEYLLKKKMLAYKYNIEIEEV